MLTFRGPQKNPFFWKKIFFAKVPTVFLVIVFSYLPKWKSCCPTTPKEGNKPKKLILLQVFLQHTVKKHVFWPFFGFLAKNGKNSQFLAVCCEKRCYDTNFLGFLPSSGVIWQVLFHFFRHVKKFNIPTFSIFLKKTIFQKNGHFWGPLKVSMCMEWKILR